MLVITRRYIYIWVTVPLSDPDVLDFFWCKKNYLVVALVRLAKRFKIWKVQESQSCTIFSLFFVWVLSKTHSENTFTVSSVVKSISQSNPSWIRCFCWSPVRMGQHWCPKKCVSVAKIERVLLYFDPSPVESVICCLSSFLWQMFWWKKSYQWIHELDLCTLGSVNHGESKDQTKQPGAVLLCRSLALGLGLQKDWVQLGQISIVPG